MKSILSSLTVNRMLFMLAVVLGILALVAGDPYVGSSVTMNGRELALMVERGADHVAARELADWIIQGKNDYRLLDLRDETAYTEYHIPTAEHVTLATLEKYPVARNEKIVLYSEDGVHASQAWFLLKARRYPGVYILRGGFEEWKEQVLFPSISSSASPEDRELFERAKSVAAFFGGAPRTDGETTTTPALTMPKLETPVPLSAPTSGAKKKKKEGC